MKKTLLVVLTVVALGAVTYWADRKWPAGSQATATLTSAPSALPEITIKDLQGRNVSLSEFKGKVVLVNFWATWCEPCRIEIPWMIKYQQKYGPRGFTVLGIAMDDEGRRAVEPFVRNERFDVDGQQAAMNYPILLGSDQIAQKFGGIIGLPTSILISRDGKKVKTVIGLVNYDELEKLIESQL